MRVVTDAPPARCVGRALGGPIDVGRHVVGEGPVSGCAAAAVTGAARRSPALHSVGPVREQWCGMGRSRTAADHATSDRGRTRLGPPARTTSSRSVASCRATEPPVHSRARLPAPGARRERLSSSASCAGRRSVSRMRRPQLSARWDSRTAAHRFGVPCRARPVELVLHRRIGGPSTSTSASTLVDAVAGESSSHRRRTTQRFLPEGGRDRPWRRGIAGGAHDRRWLHSGRHRPTFHVEHGPGE